MKSGNWNDWPKSLRKLLKWSRNKIWDPRKGSVRRLAWLLTCLIWRSKILLFQVHAQLVRKEYLEFCIVYFLSKSEHSIKTTGHLILTVNTPADPPAESTPGVPLSLWYGNSAMRRSNGNSQNLAQVLSP